MSSKKKTDPVGYYLDKIGLCERDQLKVRPIIEDLLEAELREDILMDWVCSLPRGTIWFNHDMEDGYYLVKPGSDGDTKLFYNYGNAETYIKSNKLYPVWAGSEHSKPQTLESLYNFNDVPQEYIDNYDS